jgi:Putative prokaryotic signal transducing protein
MRKVFEHPNFHEVGLCQSILNSHDIATTIKNQDVSSLSGEVPFASAFPELWVLDDSTYDQAVGLLRDYHDSARQNATRPDWTCAHCGEVVPGTFDSCWHCGHAKAVSG